MRPQRVPGSTSAIDRIACANVSTFDNALKARLEATAPGLLRTVETNRSDGLILITSHRVLSPAQRSAMTAIAGPNARFIV